MASPFIIKLMCKLEKTSVKPNGITLLLLLFLLIRSPLVEAQQNSLKFAYLTVDDGLSHTDVKEVKQDQLRFIWIATLYGLDRYDDYQINTDQ